MTRPPRKPEPPANREISRDSAAGPALPADRRPWPVFGPEGWDAQGRPNATTPPIQRFPQRTRNSIANRKSRELGPKSWVDNGLARGPASNGY